MKCKDLDTEKRCYFCYYNDDTDCFLQTLEKKNVFKTNDTVKEHFSFLCLQGCLSDYADIFFHYVKITYPQYFNSLEKIRLLI
jgi:hypothetical protein